MQKAENYKDYTCSVLKEILEADSPTGFPALVIEKLRAVLCRMGYESEISNKNVASVFVKGISSRKKICVSAHVDTLGAMVRSVSSNGEIRFTKVGGPLLPTLDGEYCRIYTRDGRVYTGTILSSSPSVHVFPDAASRTRDEDNMYVRLDEEVSSSEDVRRLGVENGCFICYDAKTVFTDSGFVKSRFLDDKAGSACLLTVLKMMKEDGLRPEYDTTFCFTNYEEVGHGAATVGKEADELLAVDMGCIGLDLSCKETQVSICAKDSSGPYDYEMVNRLIDCAKRNAVDYAVDIYPRYSSDVSASRSAGNDVRGGLIGPGVAASHGMERTHLKGIFATVDLIASYLNLR